MHPPPAHLSYPETLGKYPSLLLPHQWTLGHDTAPLNGPFLVNFRLFEFEYHLCRWFLPLAFSTQPLWSWKSMVPVPRIPAICSQLESRCPQTGVHSSYTLSEESHNPGLRTSPRAYWCRCLAPSAAGEPVDQPWMSSLPEECKNTTWTETWMSELSQIHLWADRPLIQHEPDACLCWPHLYRWHKWESLGNWEGHAMDRWSE